MITKETLSQRADGYSGARGAEKGVRKEVCVLPLAPNGKEGRAGIRAARGPQDSRGLRHPPPPARIGASFPPSSIRSRTAIMGTGDVEFIRTITILQVCSPAD